MEWTHYILEIVVSVFWFSLPFFTAILAATATILPLFYKSVRSCCKRIDKLKSQEENSRRLMNKTITKS
jgi:ABC-type molybdate transport system permease subunit